MKLIDYANRRDELEASDNSFATVVMAYLKAQQTQHDPAVRKAEKFYLVRRLYERGYARNDIVKLFHACLSLSPIYQCQLKQTRRNLDKIVYPY